MKNEPYFYWCHNSADTSPVLYAISPAPGSEVYYLGKSVQNEPKWYRSTCYDERTLLTQFNNPVPGANQLTTVHPCELLFDGVDVPPLPEKTPTPTPPPPAKLVSPARAVNWDFWNFETPLEFKAFPTLEKLTSDIADAGRYQERRAAIKHLRALANQLEKSIPAGK
jgi:hypothetical protein